MSPTVEEVLLHCRIDDDVESTLISDYIEAAVDRAKNYLNRGLYEKDIPEDDPDGLIITGSIKLALLLAVGFWYENREAQQLPEGFFSLLSPYRFIPL
ncbi:head-tail connector protein [Rosenbergiella epipactidis]|uniref:head-tail connector protein n=1 Tax=Rosenbergiella epipactidis TaxID=1544694 RepID=UPI00240E37C1|nr:head-tail connector protein [Rosenbergiella epipactidis]